LQPPPPAPFAVVSSLWDFEERFNPDKRETECDPFDFALRDGYAYVADSGGNDVVRVNTRTNEASVYAVFEELPNPLYDARLPTSFQNKPKRDAVPTGVTFGPDGALYVALLAGFPFPQECAGLGGRLPLPTLDK